MTNKPPTEYGQESKSHRSGILDEVIATTGVGALQC